MADGKSYKRFTAQNVPVLTGLVAVEGDQITTIDIWAYLCWHGIGITYPFISVYFLVQ